MDPAVILHAKDFRATSGNQVTRVIDHGDGMTPVWKRRPNDQDVNEFTEWITQKIAAKTEVTTHFGGAGEAGLANSRKGYAEWKKKLEGEH